LKFDTGIGDSCFRLSKTQQQTRVGYYRQPLKTEKEIDIVAEHPALNH